MILLSIVLIACDPSALLGLTSSSCETYELECPYGCVDDLPAEIELSGTQCGVQAGSSEESCWEAHTDHVPSTTACVYADAYSDPSSTSTCSSLTLEVCAGAATKRMVASR